jgi:hypothetical protein
MAIDIKTVSIPYYAISKIEAEEDEGKVIAVTLVREYDSDTKKLSDKVIGTKYTFLFDKNKFQTLDLKVEEKKPVITQEDIDNSEEGFIPVIIHGFSAQLYQRDGKIYIAAKAKSLEVI